MDKFEHKGKKVEIEESSNPKVSIEGEAVRVSLDVESKSYGSAEVPYRSFDSVKELAEAIVEQRAAESEGK